MYIKKAIITSVIGDMDGQKILALAIYLKKVLTNSRIKHYNLNRLSGASGITYKTLKTYVPLLEQNKYIHFEGSGNKKILVLNRLSSRNNNRNIDINMFDFTSYRGVINSLRAYIVINIQVKKEYIKQMLNNRQNPKWNIDYKNLNRKVNKMVRNGQLNSPYQKYEEYGISYERFKKELGCSIVTATKAVKYAVDHGWLEKRPNYVQTYSRGVNYYEAEGYTFTTKNNLYNIKANIYSIPPEILAQMLNLAD